MQIKKTKVLKQLYLNRHVLPGLHIYTAGTVFAEHNYTVDLIIENARREIKVAGLTAHWNVTSFPEHIRVHCVTPDAIIPVRIRITTKVLGQRDTALGKICISVIEVWYMRCVR